MNIYQILILIFQAPGIGLIGVKKNNLKIYGFVLCLFGQIFWFIETYKCNQWGMFFSTIWFAFAYLNGLINVWSEND